MRCVFCRFSVETLKQMQENHTEFYTAAGRKRLWIAEVNEEAQTIRMERSTGRITDELRIETLATVHDMVHTGQIDLDPHEIDELEINGKRYSWRWGNYITGLLKYLGCTSKIR
jgi:hypothetical protein